jgi:hypothetical protein
MANLVPLSKSSLIKPKSSAIIKADKFLAPKSSAIIKADKFLAPKSSAIVKYSDKSSQTLEGGGILNQIQKKVIKIDKLLKSSLLLKKKGTEKKRVSAEQTEFEEKEKDLEKNKPKAIPGIKLPSPPKLGIFDWIKNFITQTLLGFVFIRLYEHLPKLLKLVPIIFKAGEFLIDIGGKLLDGLVTFIDWGYKAYDATRGFVKNIFGEGGVKQFDNLMSTLNKLSSVIILASLASAMPGGPGGGGGSRSGPAGGASSGPYKYDPKRALVRKKYGDSAAKLYDLEIAKGKNSKQAINNIESRYIKKGRIIPQRMTGSLGGTNAGSNVFGRGFARAPQRLAIKGLTATLGKGGAKAVLKFVKPLVSKIPIIGGLIEFGLSWALGEPIGKAAFRGIGSVLVGAIGTAIGGPIGAFLGAWAGGEAGGALYDMFFGGKKPQQQKGQVAKAAGGGKPTTRGGRLVSGPARRTLKKKKKTRTLSFTPRKIKPGASVGGEEKVRSVFPNPEKAWWDPFGLFAGKQPEEKPEKPKEKQSNPQEFLVDSNDTLGRSNFFGPFFTLAIKSVLGQKPDQLDYKNAGKGLNSWVNTTFKSGTFGFAGGGEVDTSEFFSGEDYTNVIAKSVEDSVSKEVETTIRNLSKELSLRPVGKEEMIQKNISPDEGVDQKPDPNLDVGPGGTVTGGNADFWTLVAISRMEDSDPQGSADVAQSIYNRVASGIYGGKTIKEIVLRQGQYEPTWKYPRRGKTGVPNPEWYAIKDLATASSATGISQSDLQRTAAALRNSKYQEEARKFVGGRTDFMGGSNKPGPGDIRRRGNEPNNFFGWFVGPAAKSYGARNPGPAKAPQLGDIVVMGGGGKAGAPMVSVKGGKAFPLPKGRIGTGSGQVYGAPRSYGGHAGVDLVEANWKPGTDPKIPVVAYAGGKVVSSSPRYSHQTSGYTSNLTIDHGPFKATYLHMKPALSPGSMVSPGQKVGNLIDLANNTHLHFEAYNKGGSTINPTGLLKAAYEKGGETLDGPHMALIGEKGKEFVIDADSTAALEGTFPGFLAALNEAKYNDAIQVLRNFVSYEQPYTEPEVHYIEVPVEVPVPMPMGGGGLMMAGGGGIDNTYDTLEML